MSTIHFWTLSKAFPLTRSLLLEAQTLLNACETLNALPAYHHKNAGLEGTVGRACPPSRAPRQAACTLLRPQAAFPEGHLLRATRDRTATVTPRGDCDGGVGRRARGCSRRCRAAGGGRRAHCWGIPGGPPARSAWRGAARRSTAPRPVVGGRCRRPPPAPRPLTAPWPPSPSARRGRRRIAATTPPPAPVRPAARRGAPVWHPPPSPGASALLPARFPLLSPLPRHPQPRPAPTLGLAEVERVVGDGHTSRLPGVDLPPRVVMALLVPPLPRRPRLLRLRRLASRRRHHQHQQQRRETPGLCPAARPQPPLHRLHGPPSECTSPRRRGGAWPVPSHRLPAARPGPPTPRLPPLRGRSPRRLREERRGTGARRAALPWPPQPERGPFGGAGPGRVPAGL